MYCWQSDKAMHGGMAVRYPTTRQSVALSCTMSYRSSDRCLEYRSAKHFWQFQFSKPKSTPRPTLTCHSLMGGSANREALLGFSRTNCGVVEFTMRKWHSPRFSFDIKPSIIIITVQQTTKSVFYWIKKWVTLLKRSFPPSAIMQCGRYASDLKRERSFASTWSTNDTRSGPMHAKSVPFASVLTVSAGSAAVDCVYPLNC
jgi:hypothetical protein